MICDMHVYDSCNSCFCMVLLDFTSLLFMDPDIDHGGQLSLTAPRSSNFKGSADHFLRASNQTKAKGKGMVAPGAK